MTSSTNNQQNQKDTSKRGFASMPHEKVQEIARKGGEASHSGKGSHSSGQDDNSRKED